MLSSTCGQAALSERTCREWFQRFKSSDFDVKDRHDSEEEKIFEDSELEALLAALVPSARRVSKLIGIDSKSHFETTQSHGNDSEARKLGSVRVEAERCLTAFLCCEQLLQRQNRKGFLHRIVTEDKKLVHYDDPKRIPGVQV